MWAEIESKSSSTLVSSSTFWEREVYGHKVSRHIYVHVATMFPLQVVDVSPFSFSFLPSFYHLFPPPLSLPPPPSPLPPPSPPYPSLTTSSACRATFLCFFSASTFRLSWSLCAIQRSMSCDREYVVLRFTMPSKILYVCVWGGGVTQKHINYSN